MPVSRNPASPPSGPPSYSPDNLPIYRGGSSGGATPTFDPGSIFTASRTGDYWDPSGWYQDDAESVPADANGDVVWQWVGSRTDSTAQVFNNNTVSSRPALITDATYGLALNFASTAAKIMSAATPINTSFLANGGTMVARTYVYSETNTANRGHAIMCGSTSNPAQGLCIAGEVGAGTDNVYFGGIDPDAATTPVGPYLGAWVSIVAKITSQADDTIATIYIDDPDTPVATANLGVSGINIGLVLNLGHSGAYTSQVKHYKMACIDELSTPVSDWMSWLEA